MLWCDFDTVVLFIKSISENSPVPNFLFLKWQVCVPGVQDLNGGEKCCSVMNRIHPSTIVFVVCVCNVFGYKPLRFSVCLVILIC